MGAKKHVFKPGDRVRLTKIASTESHFGTCVAMNDVIGKYRIVDRVGGFGYADSVTFRGDKDYNERGDADDRKGFLYHVNDLRFVRSAAQAKAAATRQRAKRANPVVAHVREVLP